MHLVFLPGLLCDAEIWAAQADALARRAESVTIADLTQDDSVAAMAGRVLATAPRRFVLVALSMGGYVAFEILRQAAERVVGAALFDTSAAPDSPQRSLRRHEAIASLERGRFAGVTRRLLPELIHPDRLDEPVGDTIREMAARVGGAAFRRQQAAILGRPDSRVLLDGLDLPMLVAVGDRDVLTPPGEALDIHIRARNSSFHLVRDCGHLPPLERPAETTGLIELFLDRLRDEGAISARQAGR